MNNETITSMQKLGFSEIESRIYIFLLSTSPSTGYTISKEIGKPVSNVYNSLDEMEKKGYLNSDSGSPKLYKAVQYEQLLDRLKSKFIDEISSIEKEFSNLSISSDDDSIYSIKTPGLVDEKFEYMVNNASTLVMIDVYPNPTKKIINAIAGANKNGIQVLIKSYNDFSIKGNNITVISNKMGSFSWPGTWLNVTIDLKEIILSFSGDDGYHQAVWSKNPLICKIYSDALMLEMFSDNILNKSDGYIKEYLNEQRKIFSEFVKIPPDYRSWFLRKKTNEK